MSSDDDSPSPNAAAATTTDVNPNLSSLSLTPNHQHQPAPPPPPPQQSDVVDEATALRDQTSTEETDHESVPSRALNYPASPTSSGYAAERGSSSSPASTAGEIEQEDGDDDDDDDDNGVVNGGVDSGSHSWTPGKRHQHEDDASLSWRKRKKHFFVLSHSGKPIYSRYGDEHKLAGFSATLQAIISFVENGGDRVKLVRAGNHQVVFLVKGPIYLVCISCTEEPYDSLRGQLELLYGQMILILTKSVNRCFEKNPKFDMTPLLGGTDAVFSSLIHSFSWYVSS
ncbi:vacuolar fusion protein MON1 homolog [Silene latifolia]|uniref:vacuolar fusion protein MON1 homolog n=1 Tax=Silene latifolia TaxID=37657 RepID=UPI003D7885BE